MLVSCSEKVHDNGDGVPSLEIRPGAGPRIVCGERVNFDFNRFANVSCDWNLTAGTLPKGLKFRNNRLRGRTLQVGEFPVRMVVTNGDECVEQDFSLVVRGRNIAPQGRFVVSSVPGKECCGYEWDNHVTVDLVSLSCNNPSDMFRLFSDIRVEYLNPFGDWQKIPSVVLPEFSEEDASAVQPDEYLFFFYPIRTRGIRITGDLKLPEGKEEVLLNDLVPKVQVYEVPKNE